VVACVTATLIEGRPRHLPGIALGSPVTRDSDCTAGGMPTLIAAARMHGTGQRIAR
jgi:hypothetical protein